MTGYHNLPRSDAQMGDGWDYGFLHAADVARNWAYRNLTATQAQIDEAATRFALGYDADWDAIKDAIYGVLRDAARAR